MSRRKFIAVSALLSAILIAVPFACNETLSETFYTVVTDKVTSPVKIAFFSDVHSTYYGHDMYELVDSVKRVSPDIVLFGGDLFDLQWGEKNSVTLVKRLTALYPCFYAIGNHETKHGLEEQNKIKSETEKLGVSVLDGKYHDISVDGTTIRLHGIDGVLYSDQLETCENAADSQMFNILLEHFPEEFPLLCGKGFDLVLSGHAHGGQWRLPPLINGVYAPNQGFFPKYTSGSYKQDGTEMIVSRGLKRSVRDIIVPRIFNRPEIVYITLKPQ